MHTSTSEAWKHGQPPNSNKKSRFGALPKQEQGTISMVGSRDSITHRWRRSVFPEADTLYTRCPVPESRSVVIKERYWWPTLSAWVSCWRLNHSFTVISSNVFRLWTRQDKGEYRRTVFQYSRVDKLTDHQGLYRSPSCARHVFVSGDGCFHLTRPRTTIMALNMSIR